MMPCGQLDEVFDGLKWKNLLFVWTQKTPRVNLFSRSSPSYLNEVLRNMLAILQHPDWRNDPVPLDPGHALGQTFPRVKNSRIQLSFTVMKLAGAARLQGTATVKSNGEMFLPVWTSRLFQLQLFKMVSSECIHRDLQNLNSLYYSDQ